MAAEENDLRVLIVEDDPMTADAHADFIRRIPGFTVAGISLGGTAALERFNMFTAAGEAVDLVHLDMNLVDAHGVEAASVRGSLQGMGRA